MTPSPTPLVRDAAVDDVTKVVDAVTNVVVVVVVATADAAACFATRRPNKLN